MVCSSWARPVSATTGAVDNSSTAPVVAEIFSLAGGRVVFSSTPAFPAGQQFDFTRDHTGKWLGNKEFTAFTNLQSNVARIRKLRTLS